jgi:hypothetical protein
MVKLTANQPAEKEWLVKILLKGENGKPDEYDTQTIIAECQDEAIFHAEGIVEIINEVTRESWILESVEPIAQRDTKIMCMFFSDGPCFEQEFPQDYDTEDACVYMLNRIKERKRDHPAPTGFARLLTEEDVETATAVNYNYVLKYVLVKRDDFAPDVEYGFETELESEWAEPDYTNMKAQQLCNIAIDIMNRLPQLGDHAEKTLREINGHIVRRIIFWLFMAMALSTAFALGAGMLTLHLAGGTMLASSLNWVKGLSFLGGMAICSALYNKKYIPLRNWAAACSADLLRRKREALEETVEILGGNLKEAMHYFYMPSARQTYKGERFEVWKLSKEDFERLCDISDEAWESWCDENEAFAWFRAGRSIYEGCDLYEFDVNGEKMLGYLDRTCKTSVEHFTSCDYEDFTHYACKVLGHSTEKNITCLATSLADENDMTLAEFMTKYQP